MKNRDLTSNNHKECIRIERILLFERLREIQGSGVRIPVGTVAMTTIVVYVLKSEWRTGVSIPVPLECESSALPFELVPLDSFVNKTRCGDVELAIFRFFVKTGSGEPGHRSPYLSHAKRALYHLS